MRSNERRRSATRQDPAEVLITPGDPRWEEFLERLTGPLGLGLGAGGWHCAGGEDKRHSRRVLLGMGLSPAAVEANLAFFERHGGYCDCEVWMNVEGSVGWSEAGDGEPGERPPGLLPEGAELWGDQW